MGTIIDFHLNETAEHQLYHAKMLEMGMNEHGDICRFLPRDTFTDGDIHCIWSWKQPNLIRTCLDNKTPLLVMERGYIDRNNWCSLCFNGLNGMGVVDTTDVKPDRWKFFKRSIFPWRAKPDSTIALLMGQVPNDPSLYGMDLYQWLNKTTEQLIKRGYTVIYRPHPWVKAKIDRGYLPDFCPVGAHPSYSPDLYQMLSECGICVTFNSNSAIDAVLFGVPTVTFHEGSIAWEVTSHDLDNPIYTPDRTEWCNKLAYRQWTVEELKNGTAWGHVKKTLKLFS